jgi:short-subunit dehydrogenase
MLACLLASVVMVAARHQQPTTPKIYYNTLYTRDNITGSKFALEAYSQSLRQEFYMTNPNIDVCVINPGFVKPTLLMAEGLKLTETMWKQCEQNLGSTVAKDEYRGTMMDHFLEYSSLQPGTHVSKVVEAAEQALLSIVPRTSYKVGVDSKLAPIVGLMPTGMREWIARNGIYSVLSPAGTVKGYQV